VNASLPSQIILIGAEGDFTPEEVTFATEHFFIPVTLGDTRLRTETAGMVSAVLLKAVN
jgi:16S rRNA (uracil1498-N3)-methyltransferase